MVHGHPARFHWRRSHGNLHLAESQHQQALIAYRQTIQRAFGDVSDALIGYDKLHQSASPAGSQLLTCRSRFASPLFVIKEELRHIWKFWMAKDRFTAPNFHSQVHEVTNSAAWSNCIGHWEEGGSGDLVDASPLGQRSSASG